MRPGPLSLDSPLCEMGCAIVSVNLLGSKGRSPADQSGLNPADGIDQSLSRFGKQSCEGDVDKLPKVKVPVTGVIVFVVQGHCCVENVSLELLSGEPPS